ncbi:uncharacterized protein LOC105834127 isoform X2 [Monomorium pharaonis]|nr:uncharacterized protein LOC105834127 isoform X2 [Monomorium pharaonis]
MSNEKNLKFTSSNSKISKKHRKDQCCGRCSDHNVKNIRVAGHKRYCPYRNCTCEICIRYLEKKRESANKIALKRAQKLDTERKRLPQEVPPEPIKTNEHRKCSIHSLVYNIWEQMHNPRFESYISPQMFRIFRILIRYTYDLERGYDSPELLKLAQNKVLHVIYEDSLAIQQAACCYLAPPVVPHEELFGIRSLHYPFQNFPIWSTDRLSILAANTFSFPENSLKPPAESSTEPFIDPSTEPSSEPSEFSTDHSTESSTY